MKLGIHTKINEGFAKAVERLVQLDCNTCQVFSRSPRGGKARVWSADEVKTFRDLCRRHQISPVVVHIPYIINPATSDPEMHAYAVSIIKEDLARADLLGAAYLVLHMGSHRGQGPERGLAQVTEALQSALKGYHGQTVLLLENTAGAGSEVGVTFEQLHHILAELKPYQAGICFDTCHGFAAGYDLSGPPSVEETLREFDRLLGLANLKLIHLNDSTFPLGSTKDRHADIGWGKIGERGIKAVLQHPRLRDLPFILETPAGSDADWACNLAEVRRLVRGRQ